MINYFVIIVIINLNWKKNTQRLRPFDNWQAFITWLRAKLYFFILYNRALSFSPNTD